MSDKNLRRIILYATRGVPQAKMFVANIYRSGSKELSSEPGFVFWLLEAAKSWDKDALRELGRYYIENKITVDCKKNIIFFTKKETTKIQQETGKYYLKASYLLGDSKSRITLGVFCSCEPVGSYEFHYGIKILHEAVLDQDPDAFYPYALSLMKYKDRHDKGRIIKYLGLASVHGVAEASLLLGIFHDEGLIKNENIFSSFFYYKCAAEGGSVEGMLRYGLALLTNPSPHTDLFTGENMLRASARNGSLEACLVLEQLYSQGTYLIKNTSEARAWKEKYYLLQRSKL